MFSLCICFYSYIFLAVLAFTFCFTGIVMQIPRQIISTLKLSWKKNWFGLFQNFTWRAQFSHQLNLKLYASCIKHCIKRISTVRYYVTIWRLERPFYLLNGTNFPLSAFFISDFLHYLHDNSRQGKEMRLMHDAFIPVLTNTVVTGIPAHVIKCMHFF